MAVEHLKVYYVAENLNFWFYSDIINSNSHMRLVATVLDSTIVGRLKTGVKGSKYSYGQK